MTSFLLQKSGGQKVPTFSSYSAMLFGGVSDEERTSPVVFMLMRIDGMFIRPVGSFDDEVLATRIVELLNRNGLEGTPLEALPAIGDEG